MSNQEMTTGAAESYLAEAFRRKKEAAMSNADRLEEEKRTEQAEELEYTLFECEMAISAADYFKDELKRLKAERDDYRDALHESTCQLESANASCNLLKIDNETSHDQLMEVIAERDSLLHERERLFIDEEWLREEREDERKNAARRCMEICAITAYNREVGDNWNDCAEAIKAEFGLEE